MLRTVYDNDIRGNSLLKELILKRGEDCLLGYLVKKKRHRDYLIGGVEISQSTTEDSLD